MEIINLAFDLVLVFASLWMVMVLRRLTVGGVMGSTLNLIAIGTIVLGIAHILETFTFQILHLETDVVEFLHRVIVFAGFALLIWGYRHLSRELKAE